MAPLRSNVPQVGSIQWIHGETRQAEQILEQEVEEFAFSVRNEMEWLNEHMSDILSKTHDNVADIFKTPGKLRGKTPRTARKFIPTEARAPLTDIFAPNPQFNTSPHKTQFYKSLVKFQVAEDAQANTPRSPTRNQAPAARGKENADSGYHGVTDDELEVNQLPTVLRVSPAKKIVILKAPQPMLAPAIIEEPRRTTDESFVSAHERQRSTSASLDRNTEVEGANATALDDDMDLVLSDPAPVAETGTEKPRSPQYSISNETASALNSVIHHPRNSQDAPDGEDIRSASEESSPVKQIVRKSSLTFASLPAREPLAKKSVGARQSRTSHVDQFKQSGPARQSQYSRYTGGKSLGGSQTTASTMPSEQTTQEDAMDWEDTQPTSQESEATKLHNKTSTQRLHERINMLGQSKDNRVSKIVTHTQQSSQPSYPQLPSFDGEKSQSDVESRLPQEQLHKGDPDVEMEEEDDDWIAPIKPPALTSVPARPQLLKSQSAEVMEQISGHSSIGGLEKLVNNNQHSRVGSPLRPTFGHAKSTSASAIPSPAKFSAAALSHKKGISVSNPDMFAALETTTPPGSPTAKRNPDGPLSASKAKFFSVLKSAKERLIASAGISAQAKMETLSPSHRSKQITQMPSLEQIFSPKRDIRLIPPSGDVHPQNIEGAGGFMYNAPLSPSKPEEGRRTRSSSEKRKEKAVKEQQRHEDNLEKARAKVREEVAVQSQKNKIAGQHSAQPSGEYKPDASCSKEMLASSADERPPPAPKSQLPTALPQKSKEPRRLLKPSKENLQKQPVVVKVAMNRQFPQHPASNTASASSQETSSLAPSTKTSNESVRTTTSAASTRQKALDAAAKKKELAAQRRADQKREQEQKRLKQEEERRLEQQRKVAEQRAQDAKRAAAQKQTMEAKHRQQQANRPGSRQANNLAAALQQEKSNVPPHPRADLGAARPMSRMNTVHDQPRPVPPINPAKPPKRMFQPEDDEPVPRSTLQRPGPNFQQLEGKRRKTDEKDEDQSDPRRSVMKPPIRQSAMRKEQQNKFPHGYMTAQTPASHTLLKAAVTSAQQQKSNHPHELAKFSNAKIPFAENANASAGPSAQQYQSAYKTPVRGNAPQGLQNTSKSSPHYPASEAITLPEIATDSEDEDSENEFNQPSWADSPALRELLVAQQLIDPETIFGPIPPLQMEEIFKNKDRHKRFRDRTSSANWSGADRLTEEEKQRDREARQRLMRDGGWTFQTGN